MNKYRYRIIFNREKGQLMVVSELTSRNNCITTVSSAPRIISKGIVAKLRPLYLLLGMVLGNVVVMDAVAANIVADNSAAAHQKPQITQASKGPAIVNIQTPNKNGFSHNKYNKFDINKKGVILNNSQQAVQTELGGRIEGNTNLARGEAKVILNEVNSRYPSKLNGYIEVAGKKAQVIIANPSGISCNDCGFINADRATLTTGKPQIEDGQLRGYNVRQGAIIFTGKGLKNSRENYTEIIARSVKVNAGIHGKDIKVITGRNNISADLKNIESDQENTNSSKIKELPPKFAIDVSALGGMYAGKIHLIGTEKGVGVNHIGQFKATAGDITLTVDGKITNKGTILAQENITLTSNNNIENSKQIKSVAKNIRLVSKTNIVNTGTINASNDIELHADKVTTSAVSTLQTGQGNHVDKFVKGGDITVTAKEARLNGKNTASRNITVTGTNYVNLANNETNASALTISGDVIDLTKATLNAKDDITLIGRDINSNNLKAKTNKNYRVKSIEKLNNQNANIEATEDIVFDGILVNNNNAQLISSQSIKLTSFGSHDAAYLSNNKAKLIAQKDININAENKITDNNSQLRAGGVLQIKSRILENTTSLLQANSDIILNNTYTSNNQATKFITEGNFVANVGSFDNTTGSLTAKGNVFIKSDLDVEITNAAATGNININAGRDISVGHLTDYSILAGELVSKKNITLTGGKNVYIFDNSLIKSHGKTAIEAEIFTNANASQILTDDDFVVRTTLAALNAGKIKTNGSITIDAGTQFNHYGGQMISNDKIAINSLEINNENASLDAANDLILQAVYLANTDTTLTTKGELNLFGSEIRNQGGNFLSKKSMNITADNIDSTLASLKAITSADWEINEAKESMVNFINDASISIKETLLTAMGSIHINANTLESTNATLKANHDIILNNTFTSNNKATKFITEGNFIANVRSFDNTAGSLTTKGDILINSLSDVKLTKAEAAGDININAEESILFERAKNHPVYKSELIAGKDINLYSKKDIVAIYENGIVRANGKVVIDSTFFTNDKGQLIAGDDLIIRTRLGTLNTGDIKVNGSITIDAFALFVSHQGRMFSNDKISINSLEIENENSYFEAGHDLTFRAIDLRNIDTTLSTKGNLNLLGAVTRVQQSDLRSEKSINISTGNIDSTIVSIQSNSSLDWDADNIKQEMSGYVDKLASSIKETSMTATDEIYINADTIDIEQSKLQANGNITLDNTAASNNKATAFITEGDFIAKVSLFDNSGGFVTAKGDVLIDAQQAITTEISAVGNLNLNILGKYVNTSGNLLSGKDMKISAAEIYNDKGLIQSYGEIVIDSHYVHNKYGKLISANKMSIIAHDSINNLNGYLKADSDLILHSPKIDNLKGMLITNGTLHLMDNTIIENQDAIIYAKNPGSTNSNMMNHNLTSLHLDYKENTISNGVPTYNTKESI